jgi:hypothetical protein
MLTSVEVSGVAMAELSIGSLLWMIILHIVGATSSQRSLVWNLSYQSYSRCWK